MVEIGRSGLRIDGMLLARRPSATGLTILEIWTTPLPRGRRAFVLSLAGKILFDTGPRLTAQRACEALERFAERNKGRV